LNMIVKAGGCPQGSCSERHPRPPTHPPTIAIIFLASFKGGHDSLRGFYTLFNTYTLM
jgi:hypothetical protein